MSNTTSASEREQLAKEESKHYNTTYKLPKRPTKDEINVFAKLCYEDGFHDGHLVKERQANGGGNG